MTEVNLMDAERSLRPRSSLERLIAVPRRRITQQVELGASSARVWELVRHTDLAQRTLLRAFLGVWSPARSRSDPSSRHRLSVDDFRSTPARPGFQILADEPLRELTVGALARVRRLHLEFLHVGDAATFMQFSEPGCVQLAWSMRISQRRADCSRLAFEFRIGATDEAGWRAARGYFAAIGPGVDWVIREVLGSMADALGWPTRFGSITDARAH